MRTINQLKVARDAAINVLGSTLWDCAADELVTWYSTGDGERDFRWVSLPNDADLSDADLSSADLSSADLRSADLRGADLRDADLSDADLRDADLSDADLSNADLRGADLSSADLRSADLSGADLSSANLSDADLRGANLSDATGLLDPVEYMNANFERTADGYIVYKSFGTVYAMPQRWTIAPGSVITETVNPDRGTDCGCGINVATRTWGQFQSAKTWECLIRYEWLMGVVVPFHTDGRIRTARLELVKEIDR
jgi:hypothetical protein